MSLSTLKNGFWLRLSRLFLEFRPNIAPQEENAWKDGFLRKILTIGEAYAKVYQPI
jgi:hypothetical protein